MAKLIIGFSKPKDHPFPVFSKLIQWFEGVDYSHSYVKWYSSTYDTYLVYHAAGFGLHFLGEKEASRRLDIVKEYELEVDPEIKRALVGYCIREAGTPYGLKTVFGLALTRIFKLRSNPFSDGDRTQFCSEAVANILSNHFNIELHKPAEEFGVRDLELLMKELTQG